MGDGWRNQLFYGDNLDVLRHRIADESVDLIYLDPPFNSNRSYNVLFKHKSGDDSQAQIEAFDDTWTWSYEAEEQYQQIINGGAPLKVADAMEAMRRLLGENDVLAYLVMMAARLVELHRVLKPTGSLYLHCDPTASHYLRVLLDAIFGPKRFRNEIIWHYSGWNKKLGNHFERRHDVLLFYGVSDAQAFNSYSLPWTSKKEYVRVRKQKLLTDVDGREYVMSDRGGGKRIKRYIDEAMEYGKPIDDVWNIDKINNSSLESLGYQTQKPLPLVERIIAASSNEGDIVLDPFCGCGTTIDAAQKLDRRWQGIDVTVLAIDLIKNRLKNIYGDSIENTFTISGTPTDLDSAERLHRQSALEFERWAVSLVDGQPNEKQVGDKGIDGVIRFHADSKGSTDRILVSVKGGRQLGPQMVRDLVGTVASNRAAGGVLITLASPTRGMVEAANHAGLFRHDRHGRSYPKIQLASVPDLLAGKRPTLPPVALPYIQAQRRPKNDAQQTIF